MSENVAKKGRELQTSHNSIVSSELFIVKIMVRSASSASSASNRMHHSNDDSHTAGAEEEKEPKLEEASLLPGNILGNMSI
jgi:hypothetical protein